jgi:hypothetical protein
MPGKNFYLVGQTVQLRKNGVLQGFEIPSRQIRAANAVVKQNIATD